MGKRLYHYKIMEDINEARANNQATELNLIQNALPRPRRRQTIDMDVLTKRRISRDLQDYGSRSLKMLFKSNQATNYHFTASLLGIEQEINGIRNEIKKDLKTFKEDIQKETKEDLKTFKEEMRKETKEDLKTFKEDIMREIKEELRLFKVDINNLLQNRN